MDPNLEHDATMHPDHQRRLAQAVMKRQVSLSLKVASVFIVILIGLPLVNLYMPELMNAPFLGFTVTWFFLAILFYPITWVLSWWFIKRSNQIESDLAASLHHGTATTPEDPNA